MNIGSTMTRLRKENKLSREDLGKMAGTYGVLTRDFNAKKAYSS